MLLNRLNRVQSIRPLSSQLSSSYDIAIVGGGLVGNALACAIASSCHLRSKRVLLLESGRPRSLPSKAQSAYGIRVSAVNPSSVELFKKLGIWDRLCAYRTQSVSDLYVMDSCSQSRIHFEQLNSQTPIAHIIENDAIISALYDRITELASTSNITIEAECRVKSCSLPNDLSENATVSLADGRAFETSLLVGADGARSCVREAMNTGYTNWEYEQSAVVTTLEISTIEKSSIAWQRFTPLGPIALLPLSNSLVSLVWTTSTADAKRLLNVSESEFIDELNHYLLTESQQNSFANKAIFATDKLFSIISSTRKTNLRTPTIVSIQHGSTRAAFPLAFGHSNDYITTRAALIGDAAHRVHPLAGQGVNLGWFDVQCLIECLEKCASEGADIGSTTYLADYDTRSQRHNVPVMLMIDGLKRLYSNEFIPFVLLRSLGLNVVDKLLPLKDLIIHRASV